MKLKFKEVAGSVLAPKGFSGAGVFCDIKRIGTGKGSNKGPKNDLAIIASDTPASVAGLFTTNQVAAAPVKLSLKRAARDQAQAVVVNSGNANACTGKRGDADALRMAAETAALLKTPERAVLVASTGRIGVPLPMENVVQGIKAAAAKLGSTVQDADEIARAIMTSDTRPKQAAIEFELGGKTVRLGGICKGAGMIQPGMSPTGRPPASPAALHATMLAFITTDASVAPNVLKRALAAAVGQSFNRITVDGDMSTNDTVLVLANGRAGNKTVSSASGQDGATFQAALDSVTLALAKMIVRDGEGVSKFITLRLHGARNQTEAEAAARAIVNSTLVRTSWCGGDPNWGRILCALGYSKARIAEERVDLGYSLPGKRAILYALKKGQPAKTSFEKLCAITTQPEFDLHVFLNSGRGETIMYAADLTEEYVDFNKGDVTDPSSLGG